jgi:hypothetical protein
VTQMSPLARAPRLVTARVHTRTHHARHAATDA